MRSNPPRTRNASTLWGKLLLAWHATSGLDEVDHPLYLQRMKMKRLKGDLLSRVKEVATAKGWRWGYWPDDRAYGFFNYLAHFDTPHGLVAFHFSPDEKAATDDRGRLDELWMGLLLNARLRDAGSSEGIAGLQLDEAARKDVLGHLCLRPPEGESPATYRRYLEDLLEFRTVAANVAEAREALSQAEREVAEAVRAEQAEAARIMQVQRLRGGRLPQNRSRHVELKARVVEAQATAKGMKSRIQALERAVLLDEQAPVLSDTQRHLIENLRRAVQEGTLIMPYPPSWARARTPAASWNVVEHLVQAGDIPDAPASAAAEIEQFYVESADPARYLTAEAKALRYQTFRQRSPGWDPSHDAWKRGRR